MRVNSKIIPIVLLGAGAYGLSHILGGSLSVSIITGLGLAGGLLAADIVRFVRALEKSKSQIATRENNLRVTLNAIGDAVITTDHQGIITGMNPCAERLTAWPEAQAVGRPLPEVFRIINSKTRKKVADPAQKVLAEGNVIGLANHTVLIARNAMEYQIADSGAPIRDTNDRIIGVVLVFRDVTESYNKERKIENSEKLLRNLIAEAPGVLYQSRYSADHYLTETFISEKVSEIFGITVSSDNFYDRFAARIPDEDKNRFVTSARRAIEKGVPWHYEGRFIKPDGAEIWFSGDSVSKKEDGDNVHYGLLMDITDRKRWESELESSERRYRDLFNEAPVMYVITENKADKPYIVDVNHQFTKILGYERPDVLATPLADYYTADSQHILLEQGGYRRAISGQFGAEERSFVARDGRVVHTLLHALPQKNAEGEVTGTRAMYLDITDRKEAEKETKRLQAALLQAQKMEAIGTLAGGIAHDFNNILSAVVGYAQLSLNELNENNRFRHNLEQIYTAGMRASELVRQILAFSRQAKRETQPLQIGPLAKEALKLLRSTLPATIELSQKFDDGIDNVMADPTHIHQIVMNLCTNAAQSMEDSGGRITVSLEQVDLAQSDLLKLPGLKAGAHVKLTVRDTGQGITPEVMEMIFDPYFTTKANGKGTGLGLSVVHGVVKSYGGGIYAHSQPRCGTTFVVYLPAVKTKLPEDEIKTTVLPTGSETILLVDDEPILLEVGREILNMLGYSVLTRQNGHEALDLFQQIPDKIDLLISDLTMPKMTGDKLFMQVHQIRPDLPVILCTGFSGKFTEAKAIEIGVKALIHKPLVAEQLATLVRKVLDEAGAPD